MTVTRSFRLIKNDKRGGGRIGKLKRESWRRAASGRKRSRAILISVDLRTVSRNIIQILNRGTLSRDR